MYNIEVCVCVCVCVVLFVLGGERERHIILIMVTGKRHIWIGLFCRISSLS